MLLSLLLTSLIIGANPVVVLSLPAGGACKAEEPEAEPPAVPGTSAPVSPPLLPNAFYIPSSPQTPGTPVTPSAPSPVEGPGNSECVVCMETGVRMKCSLRIIFSISWPRFLVQIRFYIIVIVLIPLLVQNNRTQYPARELSSGSNINLHFYKCTFLRAVTLTH